MSSSASERVLGVKLSERVIGVMVIEKVIGVREIKKVIGVRVNERVMSRGIFCNLYGMQISLKCANTKFSVYSVFSN